MEAFEVETKVESSRESSQPEAQRSSLFSAYANTTSTILGAGTLAVPIAMSSAGVVSYALITIFVIMVNSQTATWLVRVADHLPKSEGNAGKNYEGIAKSYLGTRAAHLISLVFVFSGLSVGMSRMLFSADCLAPLFATWLAEPERPTLKLIQRMERRVLWAAGFGLVLPLGLLRDISKLQCTSSLAVVSLGLTVAFIVYCNAEALHEHPHLGKGFQLVNIDSAFFLSLAMTNSSLSCHISVIPIYESLRGGDVKTMRNIILAALATSALVYQMVGFSSYLRFGHLTSGEASNILEVVTEQVNPHTEPMKFTLAAIAGASVASSLILGMPVVLWALRSVLLSYARFHVRSSRGANGEISQLEWSLATLGLMMTILVLATAVPDIQVAMSLGGSLEGTFISFMYPALFHLTVVKKVTNFREAFCPANLRELLVIAMSVVYGVLCLSISLRRVMSKLSEKDIELDASNSTSSEAWSSSVSIMW